MARFSRFVDISDRDSYLSCLVLLSFTPAVDEVVGEDVDILPPPSTTFFGYFLAALPKFEIVMMGSILVLSCFL